MDKGRLIHPKEASTPPNMGGKVMKPLCFALSVILLFASWMPALLVPESYAQTMEWTKRYKGPGNSVDSATALVVDAQGNVYVTGFSTGAGSGWDYATIKSSPAGVRLWARRYNGPGNGYDYPNALAIDAGGNVYVTGISTGAGSGPDYATIKYSPTGEPLWLKRYNGPGNGIDAANALALDAQGNVYVTGSSEGVESQSDYATIKYSPSGVVIWVKRYNGPASSVDNARTLALDVAGNVYVTGFSMGIDSDWDYATIKYSPAGVRLWARRYNEPGNGGDQATGLALDAQGNVYVTGSSRGEGSDFDYATIKYSPFGEPQWMRWYNGPGNGGDYPHALAVV